MDNNQSEYEFNQSIATLKRLDNLIIILNELIPNYLLSNNKRESYNSIKAFLLPLIAEIRPLLKDKDQEQIDTHSKNILEGEYNFTELYKTYQWLIQKGHDKQVLFLKSDNVLDKMRR